MTIGDRISLLIKAKSLKQYEFAKKYGCDGQTIIRYKKNNRFPSGEFLQKLSEDGVNINWLLTGEGEMFLTEKKLDDVEKKFLVEIECLKKEIDGIQTMLQQVELAKRETETENKKLSADLRQKAERIISLQDRLLKLQES